MNISLKEIKLFHLNIIRRWRMSIDVNRGMYTTPKLTFLSQFKWFLSTRHSKNCIYWIVYLGEKPVGLINLTNIDLKNKKCSWGFYLGESTARGKGITQLIECNLLDFVFETLNLNKLISEVFTLNHKVIDIHKNLGSIIEGNFKDHIFKDGVFMDVTILGITKKAWHIKKQEIEYSKVNFKENRKYKKIKITKF